jgi:uncharacterized protein YkwD
MQLPKPVRGPAFALAALASATLAFALPAFAELPALSWRPATSSPKPTPPLESRNAPLHALCGASDAALEAVAARSVQSQLGGTGLLTADDLAFTLRASGDPHVWPRAWSLSGGALDDEDITRRMKAWAAGWITLGERRCGIARGSKPDGSSVIAAIAVDALADMAPLPTSARVGQWISLEGTMLVPASGVRVVLLGPRGAPKTVVASLTNGTKIKSTFSVDQPGAWLVQVLATVVTGPRPVLEAMVFAGTAPPARFVATPAPGEEAAKGAKDDADALIRMVNAARAGESLPPLARDASLDKLAQAHVEEMVRAKMVGHNVGGGDLKARIAAAGLKTKIAGENLASAKSIENAHRALWASPSHRDNLLLTQFSRIGVAAVRTPDGSVWVAQVFAS